MRYTINLTIDVAVEDFKRLKRWGTASVLRDSYLKGDERRAEIKRVKEEPEQALARLALSNLMTFVDAKIDVLNVSSDVRKVCWPSRYDS